MPGSSDCGTLKVVGITPNFGALATIDNLSIQVSGGGTLTQPRVTGHTTSTGSTLQASGAGSVLALPDVTTIAGVLGSGLLPHQLYLTDRCLKEFKLPTG